MRVLRCFASAGVICFATLSAGGQTATPATPNAGSSTEPDRASKSSLPAAQTALKTYSNDTLHLHYSYPAAFTDASAVVAAAFKASMDESPGVGKDKAHCITLPFSVMSTAGGQLSILLLVRADAACLKRSFTPDQLPEFTQGEVRGLSASGAKPRFGEPVNFAIAGHAAEQLQGTFALPTGDSMHAMVTCVLLKPDVVCWQFLGNNEESLRAMSAFPISFENGPPVTLIPPPQVKKP